MKHPRLPHVDRVEARAHQPTSLDSPLTRVRLRRRVLAGSIYRLVLAPLQLVTALQQRLASVLRLLNPQIAVEVGDAQQFDVVASTPHVHRTPSLPVELVAHVLLHHVRHAAHTPAGLRREQDVHVPALQSVHQRRLLLLRVRESTPEGAPTI